jgi:hypothetical protein
MGVASPLQRQGFFITFPPETIDFLSTLDELQYLPADTLITLLLHMQTHYHPKTAQRLEKLFTMLVPRFPLSV